MRISKLVTSAMLILALGQAELDAQPPPLSFQGQLSDSQGVPLPDGTQVDLGFGFYPSSSGGSLLLSVSVNEVVVDMGLFQVLFNQGSLTPGTMTDITSMLRNQPEVWLGVSVNGQAEMSPRVLLASTPWALSAADPAPAGGICIWSGTFDDIPTGWQLCDGSGGTPDLRDKFILGASTSFPPGSTGGANTISLDSSQLPSHDHNYTSGSEQPAHQHSIEDVYYQPTLSTVSIGGLAPTSLSYVIDSYTSQQDISTSGEHSHSQLMDDTGGGLSFDKRPAYYKLAYIIRQPQSE